MSQASILKYYSKTTAPLPPPCSSRVGHAPPAKKRCVGRPRKVKRNSPAPETEREGKGSGELEANDFRQATLTPTQRIDLLGCQVLAQCTVAHPAQASKRSYRHDSHVQHF